MAEVLFFGTLFSYRYSRLLSQTSCPAVALRSSEGNQDVLLLDLPHAGIQIPNPNCIPDPAVYG